MLSARKLSAQQRQFCQSAFATPEKAGLRLLIKHRLAFQTDPDKRLDNTTSHSGQNLSNDGPTLCYLLAKLHYTETGSTEAIEKLLQSKTDENAPETADYFCDLLTRYFPAHENRPHLQALIREDLTNADHYLPRKQRLNLAGLSFEDKTFTGAYLMNTNLSGARMVRVIWDGAVLGPAEREPIITGTTMDPRSIGGCIFLNCRGEGDGVAMRFEKLAPALHLRIQKDPHYCHLVQRTHFLHKLQRIFTPDGSGRVEAALDAITEADYPSIPGNKTATAKLHQHCDRLLYYFQKTSEEYQKTDPGSPEEKVLTDRLGNLYTQLSVWDSVETNVKLVAAEYSAIDTLALVGDELGRAHDNLSYFTLPWAIETLSEMLTDAPEAYEMLGSMGIIMTVGLAINALLTRLGYRHAGAIGMIAGVVTAGILACTTAFSPGLAGMAALFSLGLVLGRQGPGSLIQGILLNQAFHYAADHAAFVISTTPAAQRFITDYSLPKILQLGATGFYALKVYQCRQMLVRIPHLTELETIRNVGLSMQIQQFIQASLMLKHLGVSYGIDIMQHLKGAISWVTFRIPGINWQIEIPQSDLKKMLTNFEAQSDCLAALKRSPVDGAALVEYAPDKAVASQRCLRVYDPDGEGVMSIDVPTGSWSMEHFTCNSKITAEVIGPGTQWSIEGGDFPGHGTPGVCDPGVVADFSDGLRHLSGKPDTTYPTGHFSADTAPGVLLKMHAGFRPSNETLPEGISTLRPANTYVTDDLASAQAASTTYAHVKYALDKSYVFCSWAIGGVGTLASRALCCRRTKTPAKTTPKGEYQRATAFSRNLKARAQAIENSARLS